MSLPVLDQLPFTLENLPYGIISTDADDSRRCAVAIGQHALDLSKYLASSDVKTLPTPHNKLENALSAVRSVLM